MSSIIVHAQDVFYSWYRCYSVNCEAPFGFTSTRGGRHWKQWRNRSFVHPLPETNGFAPENRPLECCRFLLETTIFFRGELLVLGSVLPIFLRDVSWYPSTSTQIYASCGSLRHDTGTNMHKCFGISSHVRPSKGVLQLKRVILEFHNIQVCFEIDNKLQQLHTCLLISINVGDNIHFLQLTNITNSSPLKNKAWETGNLSFWGFFGLCSVGSLVKSRPVAVKRFRKPATRSFQLELQACLAGKKGKNVKTNLWAYMNYTVYMYIW